MIFFNSYIFFLFNKSRQTIYFVVKTHIIKKAGDNIAFYKQFVKIIPVHKFS